MDVAFTSMLKRAIVTLHHVLEQNDSLWIPVEKAWQLNERHYGGLTGLDKIKTVEKHGEEQVSQSVREDIVDWVRYPYAQIAEHKNKSVD